MKVTFNWKITRPDIANQGLEAFDPQVFRPFANHIVHYLRPVTLVVTKSSHHRQRQRRLGSTRKERIAPGDGAFDAFVVKRSIAASTQWAVSYVRPKYRSMSTKVATGTAIVACKLWIKPLRYWEGDRKNRTRSGVSHEMHHRSVPTPVLPIEKHRWIDLYPYLPMSRDKSSKYRWTCWRNDRQLVADLTSWIQSE